MNLNEAVERLKQEEADTRLFLEKFRRDGCQNSLIESQSSLASAIAEIVDAIRDLTGYGVNRIMVGDEVKSEDGIRYVVTDIIEIPNAYDEKVAGVTGNGTFILRHASRLAKTGRHFPISSILKEIRSDP